MAEILKEFRNVDFINYVGVEDFSDQLSFLYTTSLLAAFAALTSLRTYFLQPLSCFIPNTFSPAVDSEYDYVNNYCWTEGTYAIPVSEFKIDSTSDSGGLEIYSDRKIVYYQWVPFVLALQAVLFYLPRLLWHTVSFDRAGTDIGHIVKVASDAVKDDGEKHQRLVSHACRMINQLLEGNSDKIGVAKAEQEEISQRRSSRAGIKVRANNARLKLHNLIAVILPSQFTGNWLIFIYFCIKIFYLANVIMQLVIMQRFLQLNKSQYSLMGANLLWDLVKGNDWEQTMTFPRVGSCAVYFRTGAEGNWQFSQCTLPINMINEKLYIFLWFWFFFVLIATLCSTIVWMVRVTNASLSNKFVNRLFKLSDNYEEIKKDKNIRKFSRQFLKRDGTFILKMIALNSGDIICSEIIQQLWKLYRKRQVGEEEGSEDGGLLRLEGCENFPNCQRHKRRGSIYQRLTKTRKFYLSHSHNSEEMADPAPLNQVQPSAPCLEEGRKDSTSCHGSDDDDHHHSDHDDDDDDGGDCDKEKLKTELIDG